MQIDRDDAERVTLLVPMARRSTLLLVLASRSAAWPPRRRGSGG